MTTTDENHLTLPDAWLGDLHPRRGGVPLPVAAPARTAPRRARALMREHAAAIASLREGGYGDPGADPARRDRRRRTVRLLAPLVRAWGDGGGVARAARGLDVLVAIGSDAALGAVYDIALRARSSGLWREARTRFDRAAAERGLTPERYADRLVPDFGLSADGSMVLDYGPRRFTVGFDEQLRPYVATSPAGCARPCRSRASRTTPSARPPHARRSRP
ncbi:hypothetical protein AB0L25_17665 [Spirillospora sp. NPDC052242]